MNEPLSHQPEVKRPYSDFQILLFILVLCLVCGLLLAVVAYSLEDVQKEAKEFDQSKQMLISAKILNHKGFFELLQIDGKILPATYDSHQKILIPFTGKGKPPPAKEDEIKKISTSRIRPLLTDQNGNVFTLTEKKITLSDYLNENKTDGFATLPLKLFYAILPNQPQSETITAEIISEDLSKADAFVFPVSGFGLWSAIYGFLTVAADGDHVIGTTWYEHAETPGLGANITEAWWQKQFYNKLIFQEESFGKTDFQTANMGIVVVKGKVKDVYGNSPKGKSAVDGMSGATLTGDGVTAAYRNSLSPYRNLLIRLNHLAQKRKE